jgi:hypothetical protein
MTIAIADELPKTPRKEPSAGGEVAQFDKLYLIFSEHNFRGFKKIGQQRLKIITNIQ